MDEGVKWIFMMRDMSVIFGLDFDRRAVHHGEPTHARRDMSVEKPAGYEVIHGDDLDTGLDSRLAGS